MSGLDHRNESEATTPHHSRKSSVFHPRTTKAGLFWIFYKKTRGGCSESLLKNQARSCEGLKLGSNLATPHRLGLALPRLMALAVVRCRGVKPEMFPPGRLVSSHTAALLIATIITCRIHRTCHNVLSLFSNIMSLFRSAEFGSPG